MRFLICRYIVFLLVFLICGCSISEKRSNLHPEDPANSDFVPYKGEPSGIDSLVDWSSEGKSDLSENGNIPTVSQIEGEESLVEIKEDIPDPDGATEREKEQEILDDALAFCDASQEFWSEGNLEKAIEALDHAYALVLSVNTDVSPELIQQKEDLRFMISKRILEIYASRYTAVNGNHDEIPLIMNEHVKKEIKLFQGRERRFFLESYKRSGRYMNMIVGALKEAGLPEELAWLPLIESGFKTRAFSSARALGLWQFIPSTGYKFGLKRDTWIDERLNQEKATKAAIAYLKELHQIFGDWTTVLAGYNCGEGRVLKRIRNQKINYLDNFWDLYTQLPRETARYVPRFLATLHILKDPAGYGFILGEPDAPVSYETVNIQKSVQLKEVAKKLGIPFKELTELNAELRYKVTPSTVYSLKVPPGTGKALIAKLDEIKKWSPPKKAYVYHRVKRGETLSLIALRFHTSIRKIVIANNIRRQHFIRVGQRLKIPLRGTSTRMIYASRDKLSNGKYRIRKGDSLWLIARKFNTNTRTLKRINNLSSTRLYVGQTLKIVE
ncbi:MAG: LysM peptidoglycan-binding domain-containing protein [Thermodesulfovibrionia bacterium]|nr:LysM peptidoglycan-binding domain-containing protein [Thermodesulfovibrionia bacterium]